MNTNIRVSINPLQKSEKVTIQCYPHTGKKKGGYKMFTVYGLTVNQVYQHIMKKVS